MDTKLKLFWIEPNGEKLLATVETFGWYGIRVGVDLDNPEDYPETTSGFCHCRLCGETQDFEVYHSEEQYDQAGLGCASYSFFPIGLMTPDRLAEDQEQCALVEFSGMVKEVIHIPAATGDAPNYWVVVETLEMHVHLALHFDDVIEPGFFIHCVTALHGRIVMDEFVELETLWEMP